MSGSPRNQTDSPRTRGITACATCRSRKTKCDNKRPTCTYCAKTGATCNYPDQEAGSSLCAAVGPQLLLALQDLAGLLRSNAIQASQVRAVESGLGSQACESLYSSYHDSSHDGLVTRKRVNGDDGGKARSRKRFRNSPQSSIGLDSVLEWSIFPIIKPVSVNRSITSGKYHETRLTHSVPSIELADLVRLEARFAAYVHPKNPIVDMRVLRQRVHEVAEHGLEWTSSTCLVALVCALGLFAEEYTIQDYQNPVSPVRPVVQVERDNLARQYWSIALKRFGLLMDQDTIEAIQCFCLAGIWHMYNMEPMEAWKFFKLASNAWYTTVFRKDRTSEYSWESIESLHTWSVEQSLYFSCLKSERELSSELSLPSSILAEISYPHTFPSPPNSDVLAAREDLYEIQKHSWYYYLAEIAFRHLLDRIVAAQEEAMELTLDKRIDRLLEDVAVFEAQLCEWHASLPESISFPIPQREVRPLREELRQHLRGRYFIVREVLYRPFVQICLCESPTGVPAKLHRITTLASQGLQYCSLRIQGTRTCRHHGSWLQTRYFFTCAMILLAASKAIFDGRSSCARELVLPVGWRELIIHKKQLFGSTWQDERGGVQDCAIILDWALNDFRKPMS